MEPLPTFDELVELAKTDPDALTALRRKTSQQLISETSAGSQQRLQALQSHIERKLQRAKNPVHASVLLSDELQRALIRLQDALLAPSSKQPLPKAQVIPFPAKGDG